MGLVTGFQKGLEGMHPENLGWENRRGHSQGNTIWEWTKELDLNGHLTLKHCTPWCMYHP